MTKRKADSYHHGELRESLIKLAIEKLAQGSKPGDLSVRALASELGVSRGAPYRHFPTGDALIAAVAVRGFQSLFAALQESQGGVEGSEPDAALVELGIAYVRFAEDRPQLYRAMFTIPASALELHPELKTASAETFSLLENTVAVFQQKREARMSSNEASLAAWAYVHGLAELTIGQLSNEARKEDSLRRLMSVMTRGL